MSLLLNINFLISYFTFLFISLTVSFHFLQALHPVMAVIIYIAYAIITTAPIKILNVEVVSDPVIIIKLNIIVNALSIHSITRSMLFGLKCISLKSLF